LRWNFHTTNMRQTATFDLSNQTSLKNRLLAWANTHTISLYLDSNNYPHPHHTSWDCLVAVGLHDKIEAGASHAFSALRDFYDQKQDWLFGIFGYDLKNEVEKLRSDHPDHIGMPDLFFFQPQIVAGIRHNQLEIFALDRDPREVYETIIRAEDPVPDLEPPNRLHYTPRIPKPEFDFNVVIRSILYNATTHYLSFQVGGAIVYDSVPEQEHEECLVKAEAMRKALGE